MMGVDSVGRETISVNGILGRLDGWDTLIDLIYDLVERYGIIVGFEMMSDSML